MRTISGICCSRRQVAGREEAGIAQRLALVVDDQVVGQPARLRTGRGWHCARPTPGEEKHCPE